MINYYLIIINSIFLISSFKSFSQSLTEEKQITLGAYYFDGWTGTTYHITPALKNFTDRKPTYGWVTSTQEIMDEQLDVAYSSGINFFSYCWYQPSNFKGNVGTDPKNNALKLHFNSKNRSKVKFTLMVANHKGYYISPKEWTKLYEYWTQILKDEDYLKANNKPLITFFDIRSLIDSFGSSENVKSAFERFRLHCSNAQMPGVSIAICIGNDDSLLINKAKACGFDILTAYNSHTEGYSGKQLVIPIDSLIIKENKMRTALIRYNISYIPTATLNWDKRPVHKGNQTSPRYIGFSENSVYRSVSLLKKWVDNHQGNVTNERLAILYAWNEYAEGAWLTPVENSKEDLLRAVKEALK